MNKLQLAKIDEIIPQGYTYNETRSICSCAVIFEKGKDFYFFGFDGTILFNPTMLLSLSHLKS